MKTVCIRHDRNCRTGRWVVCDPEVWLWIEHFRLLRPIEMYFLYWPDLTLCVPSSWKMASQAVQVEAPEEEVNEDMKINGYTTVLVNYLSLLLSVRPFLTDLVPTSSGVFIVTFFYFVICTVLRNRKNSEELNLDGFGSDTRWKASLVAGKRLKSLVGDYTDVLNPGWLWKSRLEC